MLTNFESILISCINFIHDFKRLEQLKSKAQYEESSESLQEQKFSVRPANIF